MAHESTEHQIILFHDAEAGNVNGRAIDLDRCLGSLLAIHLKAAASWDGTAYFEGTIDGVDPWPAVQGEKISDGTPVTFASGLALDENFRFDVAGLCHFRIRIVGRTAGTLTARGRAVCA